MQVLRVVLVDLGVKFISDVDGPVLTVLHVNQLFESWADTCEEHIQRLRKPLIDGMAVSELLPQGLKFSVGHKFLKIAINHIFGSFLTEVFEQFLFVLFCKLYL